MLPSSQIESIVSTYQPALRRYEENYKHFHENPELSLQESSTAAEVAQHLRRLGFKVTENIGGHGIVGVLSSGTDTGPTVLLRADMDALPIEEKTGLPYASQKRMIDISDNIEKPVMHACGHDMHITSLLAAAELLKAAETAEKWKGTLIVLFQPNEERAGGARAMVEDRLYERVPRPDIVLGGHVFPGRSGNVGIRPGAMAAAADSFKITLTGRGGHGAEPHRTIDPIVMAANVVLRLQTIVSREVDPIQSAVITIGSLHAGSAENVIPETAELKVNVRTFDPTVREKVLAAMRRIVHAECDASGAKEPIIEPTTTFPLLWNDESATETLSQLFEAHFGIGNFDKDVEKIRASEDFGILATSVGAPSCFWVYGGVNANEWDEAVKNGTVNGIPGNHTKQFAPVIQPTLKTAMEAYAVAALTWLHLTA